MQIQLNGEVREFQDNLTLATLVASEAPSAKRIAIERNGTIIPRSQYAQTQLQEGDVLEIVVAVGGG